MSNVFGNLVFGIFDSLRTSSFQINYGNEGFRLVMSLLDFVKSARTSKTDVGVDAFLKSLSPFLSSKIKEVPSGEIERWITSAVTTLHSAEFSYEVLFEGMKGIKSPQDSYFLYHDCVYELIASQIPSDPNNTISFPTDNFGMTSRNILGEKEYSRLDVHTYNRENNEYVGILGRLFEFPVNVHQGWAVTNPLTENRSLVQYDVVIDAPPIGTRQVISDTIKKSDPFNRFSGEHQNHDGLYFLQHDIASLKADGKAFFLTGAGMLFMTGKAAETRRSIVESDHIEAVIALPTGSSLFTKASMDLIICNKNKPDNRKGKILMMEIDSTEAELKQYTDILANWQDMDEVASIVTVDEIKENDWNLEPKRYIAKSASFTTPHETLVSIHEKLELLHAKEKALHQSFQEAMKTILEQDNQQ